MSRVRPVGLGHQARRFITRKAADQEREAVLGHLVGAEATRVRATALLKMNAANRKSIAH